MPTLRRAQTILPLHAALLQEPAEGSSPSQASRITQSVAAIWSAQSLALVMVATGVVLEVLLAFSSKYQGFPAPSGTSFSVGKVPVQYSFLASFFPTVLAFFVGYGWNAADTTLRWFQPYVVLSRGNALADDSILDDYVMSNRAKSLYRAARKREWILYSSILTALLTSLYQPLAGALLTLNVVTFTEDDETIFATTTIGLNPDVNSLDIFLAAAEQANITPLEQSMQQIVASEGIPNDVINFPPENVLGLTIHALGFSTDSNCSLALSNIQPLINGNVTLTAIADDMCQATAIFNASQPQTQRGVVPASAQLCGLDADTPVEFLPVMFWLYAGKGAPSNDSVISLLCRPYIEIAGTDSEWGVEQAYDTDSATYGTTGLQLISAGESFYVPDVPTNNVTGLPLNGRAYNGMFFSNTSDEKSLFMNRQLLLAQILDIIKAARYYIPDPESKCDYATVPFTGASQCQADFAGAVSMFYNLYLYSIANSAYFVPSADSSVKLQATWTLQHQRIIIDALAAHALAVLLILVGSIGFVAQVHHARARSRIRLMNRTGSLAAVIAIAAQSGFGEFIGPLDTEEVIRKQLRHVRLQLDPNTGGIVMKMSNHTTDKDNAEGGRESGVADDDRVGLL